jgi:predicted nucleotidyltransferase component of viral defense system
MTPLTNVAQSKLALILNKSKELHVNHEMLLRRYVYDRFLKRIAASPYRDGLVLKGAMALNAYFDELKRPTRDIDLLGLNRQMLENVGSIFTEIANIDLGEDDGIVFLPEAFKFETIKADADDGAIRILGTAMIARARVPLKIEISFDQVLTPDAQLTTLPTLLPDMSATSMLIYSRETILAEKFQTVVRKGPRNSRIKDFFDIRALMQTQHLSGELVSTAFQRTFEQRKTEIPLELPVAYLPEFSKNNEKAWSDFLTTSSIKEKPAFSQVIAEITPFTMAFAHMALGHREIEDWMADDGFVAPGAGFGMK